MEKKLFWSAAIACVTLVVVVIALNPILRAIPLALIGYYEGPHIKSTFLESHERAVRTFVESAGFGYGRMRKKGLWNELSIVVDERLYQSWSINLIGLTSEEGDRYFEQTNPPLKDSISTAETRELTQQEIEAIEKIRAGNQTYAELPASKDNEEEGVIRLIAPIRASKECLTCHDTEVGDILGAFDYHLYTEFGPWGR